MKRLSTILFALLLAAPGWGATYRVGPGQTYETLAAFHGAVTPAAGDVVDGGGSTFTETLTLIAGGEAGAPITYRNMTIDGGGARAYGVDLAQFDHVDFEAVHCTGATTSCYYFDDDSGVSEHVNLRDLTVYSTAKRGVGIWGGKNIAFERVAFRDITGSDHDLEGDGLYVGAEDDGEPALDITVSGCTFTGSFYRGALVLVACDRATITGNTLAPSAVGLTYVVDFEPNAARTVANVIFSGNSVTPPEDIYGLLITSPASGAVARDITVGPGNTFACAGIGEGIRVATSQGGITIAGNLITDGKNYGLRLSNTAGTNVARRNKITMSATASNRAIKFETGTGAFTLDSNIVVGGDTAIYMVGAGNTVGVYHNTLVNQTANGMNPETSPVTFKNNIVSSSDASFIAIYDNSGAGTYATNLYDLVDTTSIFRWDGAYYNTLALWQTASSQDAGSVAASAGFADAGYNLLPSSGAVGAGTDLTGTVGADFYGAARTAWDIGAARYAPRGHTARARNL